MKPFPPLLSSLAVLFAGAVLTPLAGAQEVPAVKVDPKPLPQVAGTLTTFAPVVEKVAPNVVTIAISKLVRRYAAQSQNTMHNDPMVRWILGISDDNDPSPQDNDSDNGRQ